jgi:tetratricopeptide (TPR) repeat protein
MIETVLLVTFFTQAARIEGQVMDARTHAGVAFAAVELRRHNFQTDKQYTDSGGMFHFEAVAPDSYSIWVTHEDYAPAVVDIERMQMASRISIELTRPNPVKTPVEPVLSAKRFMIPENARKEFERGQKEVQRRNWDKAITHLEAGLGIYSQDASALNSLGNSYRRLNQLDKAEDAFRRSIALSDSVYVRMNLAEVLTAQGRSDEAEFVLNEFIRKTPENGDAYYGLAAMYFNAGKLQEAESIAVQGENYAHRIADIHLLLAKIYSRQQKSDKVTQELKAYMKEAPNTPESKKIEKLLKGS